MANLNPHQQFGLSSLINSSDKTVIMVKLTDSAQESILELINSKHNLPPPTIQFEENFEHGCINIPTPNATKSFAFDVKNNDKQQAGLEVIQQNGSKSLRCIGIPQHKLHVAAKEDIYEKTKARMHTIEQESKKSCTKELKTSGQFDMSNRMKTKRNFSSMSNSNSIGSILPPKLSSSKPITPPNRSDANHSNGKPISTSNGNDKNVIPIQDRISHLLALKPYSKSELLLRLQKEGMLEVEKKLISKFLINCQTNGSSYTLSKSQWPHVQDNWPLYTPEEQEIVSKRKKQYLQGPYQAETSPVTSNTTSPSLQKRPHPSPLAAEPVSKRNCFKSPEVPSQTLNSNINTSLNPSSLYNSHNQPLSNGLPKSLTHSSVASSNDINSYSNSYPNSNGSLKHMNGYGQNNDRSKGSFSSPEVSPENSNDSLDSQGNPNPHSNYRNRYGTINTQEERSRYKNDFNEAYDEYISLHTFLSSTSSKFNELKKKRHSVKKDTEARIRIAKEIKSAFKEKESNKFTKKLERFKYLHKKLEYIKNLVTAYDNTQ